MVRRLIANADDFGLTSGVNRGIVEAFLSGIVRSTSLMVNMSGFEDAVALALRSPGLAVGLHLNLTYGRPVLPPQQVPSLVSGSGCFVKDMARIRDSAAAGEIAAEFEAQAGLFLSQGLRINHIDTHHDLHRFDKVLDCVASLSTRFGVPVRCLDPQRFSIRGIPGRGRFVNYFGGQMALERLLAVVASLQDGITEIPCHPGCVDDDLRSVSTLAEERGFELQAPTHPAVMDAVLAGGVELSGR